MIFFENSVFFTAKLIPFLKSLYPCIIAKTLSLSVCGMFLNIIRLPDLVIFNYNYTNEKLNF